MSFRVSLIRFLTVSTAALLISFQGREQNPTGIEDIFQKISELDGFEKISSEEADFGFPEDAGECTTFVHPNAKPREQIIAILSSIPSEWLVYNNTDEIGVFDRIYWDKNGSLFYVHVGLGGDDSVIQLYSNGDEKTIEEFIKSISE